MIEIPVIAWILLGLWTSVVSLMLIVMYTKIQKSKPIRRRRSFKLIKGEEVE